MVGETMKILPVVLTSPRPQSTLLRTLGSLKRAGWPLIRVFDGTPDDGPTCPLGCTGGNIRLMEAVLAENQAEDALLVIEDDVVACRYVREYLEGMTWPADPNTICLCSPYCPIAYSDDAQPLESGRWKREPRGLYLAGSQAWMYPMRHLPRIVAAIRQSEFGVDRAVGTFAEEAGLDVWYHVPSLFQHVGLDGNSAVGYVDCGTIYRSDTFPGEDFDARTLLQ